MNNVNRARKIVKITPGPNPPKRHYRSVHLEPAVLARDSNPQKGPVEKLTDLCEQNRLCPSSALIK